jgi:solute carrier family 35 (UDP-sugar transporter), member A1/2/3
MVSASSSVHLTPQSQHSSSLLSSPTRPTSRASISSGGSVHSKTPSPESLLGGASHLALRLDGDDDETYDDDNNNSKDIRPRATRYSLASLYSIMSSIKVFVLLVLCLQNSMFTVLRRYSQGVLKELYSKYEVLLLGEIIKLVFSAYMIAGEMRLLQKQQQGSLTAPPHEKQHSFRQRLQYLCWSSRKMVVLALIYGAMNILSFVSLRNIGAGMFTIIAQCKILTTATFSTIILKQSYSWTKWRALIALLFGCLLFSEPVWRGNNSSANLQNPGANPILGVAAVAIEVTLSGFASIYFEKVIKVDSQHHSIWERNFQLALGSVPVYLAFITYDGGGTVGLGGGWSPLAFLVSFLGAAGGLLVALSIKYGDAILKTLATTGAILLSSVLDHFVLGGPLTSVMCIAAVQVVISICDYTFDATPSPSSSSSIIDTQIIKSHMSDDKDNDEEMALLDTGRDKRQGAADTIV